MEISPGSEPVRPVVSPESPQVPDFQILALAGQGAFGSVWVARDCSGLLHAIKVVEVARLSSSTTPHREEEALRLVRQRLPDHPHLVRIHHVSRQDSRLVYAMELADPAPGSPAADQPGYQPDTLACRLGVQQRLSVPEAIRLTLELLSAVEALHGVELVHRDVKPHNVIFVGGVPKLADVGLTAVARTSLSVAGTPGYLPLDGSTGPDADLFALGKLLYQCVTGLNPADFPALPAGALAGTDARLLRRLNPVLIRACAISRSHRFRDAGQMRDALLRVLSPRPRYTAWGVGMGLVVLLALIGMVWIIPRRHPVSDGQVAVPAEESAGAPAKEATPAPGPPDLQKAAPRPPAKVDPEFLEALRGMPLQTRAQLVTQKLKELNPRLKGRVKASVRSGKLVAVKIPPEGLQDLSPLQGLPDLASLDCSALSEKVRGDIVDLSPLKGLKLQILGVAGNQVADLSPLQGMPLQMLDCSTNTIQSLEPLRGMRLDRLLCHVNTITDLSPLADQPLTVLNCGGNPVVDWSPLARLPLNELYVSHCSFRDFSLLKGARLSLVRCEKSLVTDLSPLAGMPLVTLDCGDTRVSSVAALRQTTLRHLCIRNTPVSDLTPLASLKLEEIVLTGSQVRDLTPLKGMPIQVIELDLDVRRDGPVLRTFAPLKLINGRPRAEALP